MSPRLRPPEEVRLKRTAMSTRELRRAEVLGRVKNKTLRLTDAAKILVLSYRQTKRREDLVSRPSVVTAAKTKPHHEPVSHRRSKPAPNHPWREGHEERRKQLLQIERTALVGASASTSP
jgi:hypothetical protein